jgi:SulP family sulfate permease
MGLLNLGTVVSYIAYPVFSGFTTAAAVAILTSQIKHVLGVSGINSDAWVFT